jgi:hypothetical protein
VTTAGAGAGRDSVVQGGGWDSAWSAALDEMELAADEVERLLRHRDADELPRMTGLEFQPPTHLGPLPVDLSQRARQLLQRQLDLSTQLGLAIAGNRAQAKLVTRLNHERTTTVPLFLDSHT